MINSLTFIAIAQAATEAHTATESAGIGALGLDWRALLFQVLNFAILLALLRAFAYKPIMAVLEARRRTIAESLKNADDIAATRAQLEQAKQAVLAEARAEAVRLVEQGKARGEEVIIVAEQKAQERAEELISQAQARIEQEVTTARQGLKTEVLTLVAAATEKMIDVKLDPEKDKELITEALREAAGS